MTDDPIQVFDKYSKALGDTFMFRFGGAKPAIVSSDPAVIQHVLKTNYENYPKSEIQMRRLRHFLGPGLLTLHGEQWHRQRKLIHQGGFSTAKLSSIASTMQESLDGHFERFDREAERGAIDVASEMMKVTFGMVSRSLFSTSVRSDEVDYLSLSISTVQDFVMRQVLQPYLAPWFAISGELRKHEKMRDSCKQIIRDVVRQRRQTNSHRDMLQVLMDAVYESGETMTDDAIVHESLQLLVAGHETSSNALSWAFYLLATHPECMEQARNEFDRIVGDSQLQFADLPRLEFMSQFVEESLRLFPPFWALDRVAVKDDHVMDIAIPKGTIVVVYVHGVHHSPKFWDAPENFSPERFNKENRKHHTPFAYLPFGAGPKGCVGGNYAMLQMLMIIGRILQRYDFELAPNQQVVPHPSVLLKPKHGLKMNFEKRR
jgi:cytochrome P450